MATIINNRNIQQIRDAFAHYYPEQERDFVDGTFGIGDFSWRSRQDFENWVAKETPSRIVIKGFTDQGNIKKAQQEFEYRALHPEAVAGATPENLEELKAADAAREAARKELIEKSNQNVRAEIERQKKAHEKITPKTPTQPEPKIYVKEVPPPTPQLSDNATKLVAGIRNSPKEYVPLLTQNIEKSITPQLSGTLSSDEIHLIARDAAYKTVDAAVNTEKYFEDAKKTAILAAIAKNPEVLGRIVTDTDSLNSIRIGANEVATFQKLQTQNPRNIITAFNPELAKALFPNPEDFQITFSETQAEGYTYSFNPITLTQSYVEFLDANLKILEKVTGLPIERAKAEMMEKAGGWLESQIITHFPETAAFFAAPEAEALMGLIGMGAPISFELPAAMSSFIIDTGTMPLFNFVGGAFGVNLSIGSTAAAAATETAVLAGGGTIAVAGTAGVEASGVAAGVAAGALTGPAVIVTAPLLAIAGATIGKQLTKLVSRVQRFLKENNLTELALAVPAAFLAGGFLGIPVGIGVGAATYLATNIFTGAGLGSAFAGLGAGLKAFFTAVWSGLIAALTVPLIIFFVGVPLLTGIILLIINSGAYLVPPGEALLSEANPYISVTKTASPTGTQSSPTAITYTVTITAKKDTLTGIVIHSTCKAIKKSGSLNCPPEQIPAPPSSINAGTPFSFTFTSNYGGQYQDSLVSNTISVNAISAQGGKVSDTGSASVCFGDCPLNCFTFPSGNWPAGAANYQSNLTAAAAQLAGQYPNFAAKVCAGGPINLCYTTSDPTPAGSAGLCNGAIYARHIHTSGCDINFNQCGLRSTSDALYILTHEATHHLQDINPQTERDFEQNVPRSEWPICSYSATNGNPYESMAEGDALFVGKPSWSSCVTNYQTQYPRHYAFARDKIFGQ